VSKQYSSAPGHNFSKETKSTKPPFFVQRKNVSKY